MRTIIKDAQLLELLDNYNLNEINSRIAKRIAAEERHEERILSHDIFFQMPEKTVLDLSLEEAERLLRNYENDPDHYLYEDLKQAKSIVVERGTAKRHHRNTGWRQKSSMNTPGRWRCKEIYWASGTAVTGILLYHECRRHASAVVGGGAPFLTGHGFYSIANMLLCA